jgi:hypothetical protein
MCVQRGLQVRDVEPCGHGTDTDLLHLVFATLSYALHLCDGKFCECLAKDYAILSKKRFLVHLHMAVHPSFLNGTHETLGSESVSHSIY